MRHKISIALAAAVSSLLFVANPVWAAKKSLDKATVVAGTEADRDKSYPGWEGFQPFGEKQKEGGTGQPETGQQPQGEGQQPQPGMEQRQPEGEQGTGSPGGATGGDSGTEGGEGGSEDGQNQ
ncbi:hypothetical protein EVC37_01730 [Methylocaldum sp. BRCS4]|jgi:hypothetical protein|uniref:hypothetical protein n=1 Tax=unclassified Methylocaldum TaxID=2622260 RepID=UPI00098A1D1E|nr:hypothetical protein [Methylocaldum sp. 14B]MVF20323.1 hypothetical protein [Methylocaldum sp. BRCS4]